SEVFVEDQDDRAARRCMRDEPAVLVLDEDLGQPGAVVAHATSRCSIVGAPGDHAELPAAIAPAPPEPPQETPDPYLRAVPRPAGGVAEHDLLGLSGLEMLRARLAERVPPPPIDLLTGIRLLAADDGRAV